MPRVARIEYSGAIYYLTNRNSHGGLIFRDAEDYLRFLFALNEVCARAGWQVHAFSLMPTHFRLVIETPDATLVSEMKRFLRTYTDRFNARHGGSGELFAQRYHSKIVDGLGLGWLREICDYVHVHPARAGGLNAGQPLRAYDWSSLPSYLQPAPARPAWLRTDRVFNQHRLDGDTGAGRAELERRLEQYRASRNKWLFRGIERGWYFGDDCFRRKLLERQASRAPEDLQTGMHPEPGEEKARRIVQEELDKLWWTVADLPRHSKSDSRKIRIVQRLREQTTVTFEWIARELYMGTAAYVSHRLHHANKRRPHQEPQRLLLAK